MPTIIAAVPGRLALGTVAQASLRASKSEARSGSSGGIQVADSEAPGSPDVSVLGSARGRPVASAVALGSPDLSVSARGVPFCREASIGRLEAPIGEIAGKLGFKAPSVPFCLV